MNGSEPLNQGVAKKANTSRKTDASGTSCRPPFILWRERGPS